MPPCGGAPCAGLEQEAELLVGLARGRCRAPRTRALHVGAVDADAAAAELDAVEHEVVGAGPRRAGSLSSRSSDSSVGEVNGWWSGPSGPRRRSTRTAGSRSPTAAATSSAGDQAEAPRRARARSAPSVWRRRPGVVGDEQQQVARRGLQRRADRGQLAVREELRDRRAPARRPPRRTPTPGRPRPGPGRTRSARRAPRATARARRR